jgi:hypothetical protein
MIASLAMYPFAAVRPLYEQLWQSVRANLRDAPERLSWDDPITLWRSPDLLVAHACGWPLATELAEHVSVVGTFDLDLPGVREGRYRSVLVAGAGDAAWREGPAAINHPSSLSGSASLRASLGDMPAMVTGTHLESCRAVADGRASVAAIDALSHHFITEELPYLADALTIVGHGPSVPCLPLITADPTRVDELRAAFEAALAEPTKFAALRIRRFMSRTLDDYLPLRQLQPITDTSVPETR